MKHIIDIEKVRKGFRESGDDNALQLLDIMLTEANEQLIRVTEVAPIIKGCEEAQEMFISNHIATYLSGMKTMSRVPKNFKPDAMEDIDKLTDSLNLKLRKVS